MRDALLELIGDEARVSVSPSVLDQHGSDFTHHRPHAPDVVVFPESTDEVAAVLRYANAERIPVVPYGAGSSLEGHTIPVRGGISLDLTRMDRVVDVRPQDLLAIAEAGVTRTALNAKTQPHGLFFPVDPGADATLGGMAATNASGTTSVRYGSTRANVLALEVVLADGTVVHTGSRARKTSAGYDLTSLFIGSEGTLGVITQVTVRLHGIAELAISARITFPDLEAACRTAVAIVGGGLTAARVELLDERTLRAINAYKETSYLEAPTLFVELTGAEAAVLGDLELVQLAAEGEGALTFDSERGTDAQLALWEARHHAAFALLAAFPDKARRTSDMCVPISELPGAIRHAQELMSANGLEFTVLAHAGDGNYHVGFAFDEDDPAQRAAVQTTNDALVEYALSVGGTCSGEHGIGLGKIGYLQREHGDLLPLMQGIKRQLDPNGILNPGKVLPPD
jgi:D-lactate dehydrogenase (cytochrome)